MNRPRIAVMGTFDTKAEEYQYIIDRIGQLGADVLTIDVSTRDTAVLRGEYGCREIAQYAGSTYELLTSGTRAGHHHGGRNEAGAPAAAGGSDSGPCQHRR